MHLELPPRRTILLCVAFVAPCAVLALSVLSIVRDTAHDTNSTATGIAEARGAPAAAMPAAASASSAPSIENPEGSSSAFYDETDDGEPLPAKRVARKHSPTVQRAAVESCSTASVEGLSRQIIEQARCIKPTAFVPLPTRPNLVLASNVFPYLELDAQKHLLRALDARSTEKMTINSAFRTVAQQYLVWRWAAAKHCGVQLATPPGESNHEVGAALDIAEAARWRTALEAQDFRWLGASDRVHFDYQGGDPSPRGATDVLAFQTLWNRNHPDDRIAADGHYSPATEQRLKQSPPDGFPSGSTCGKSDGQKR